MVSGVVVGVVLPTRRVDAGGGMVGCRDGSEALNVCVDVGVEGLEVESLGLSPLCALTQAVEAWCLLLGITTQHVC